MKRSDIFTVLGGDQYVPKSLYDALVAERDEADRRAGAAERNLAKADAKLDRVEIAKRICTAMGDDWNREGPGGLMQAYGPIADAILEK